MLLIFPPGVCTVLKYLNCSRYIIGRSVTFSVDAARHLSLAHSKTRQQTNQSNILARLQQNKSQILARSRQNHSKITAKSNGKITTQQKHLKIRSAISQQDQSKPQSRNAGSQEDETTNITAKKNRAHNQSNITANHLKIEAKLQQNRSKMG